MDSQFIGPDGNEYANECNSNPGPTPMTAWFNDDNGDCISDDWILQINPPTDDPGFWSNDDQQSAFGVPNLNFGIGQFSCCDYASNGGSDNSCECSWAAAPDGTIIIDCPPCYTD